MFIITLYVLCMMLHIYVYYSNWYSCVWKLTWPNVSTRVHQCPRMFTSVLACAHVYIRFIANFSACHMCVTLNLSLTCTITVAQRWSGYWQPSWRRLILTSRSCHVWWDVVWGDVVWRGIAWAVCMLLLCGKQDFTVTRTMWQAKAIAAAWCTSLARECEVPQCWINYSPPGGSGSCLLPETAIIP